MPPAGKGKKRKPLDPAPPPPVVSDPGASVNLTDDDTMVYANGQGYTPGAESWAQFESHNNDNPSAMSGGGLVGAVPVNDDGTVQLHMRKEVAFPEAGLPCTLNVRLWDADHSAKDSQVYS